ncbi:MAG: pyridoxal phosphate-dependent aminotransferase [Salinigranum sp.]
MEYTEPQFFRVMQYALEADRDVVDMVSGNPDWEPPTALREGLRDFADGDVRTFQYPTSEGLRVLREEIAARRGVEEGQVVVTNGAAEANYLAMARAVERDAGSEFLLTDPVYPYYPGKATMLGAEHALVPVEPDGSLDVEAMWDAASDDTAGIVVNTPNNPTGAVYDREAMRSLVDLAEDHDALLIADEVYDHFDHTGAFESALSIDSGNRIVTGGFSKSMAITGLRVGYGIFPPEHAPPAKTRHMLVNISASRPAQAAVARALSETGPDYYEDNRALVRERVESFTDALDAAGASYTRPDGAFYVLARFEEFPGTFENVRRLVDEAGVAGMPGEAFGDAYAEWIRFALVTPRVAEAGERLAAYFE